MHGKGKFTWPDGKFYEGEYKNDKKDGYGKYFWEGKSYEGTWLNGKQNGYGSIYINNELILKGFWRYGKVIKKDFEKRENFDNFSLGTNGLAENNKKNQVNSENSEKKNTEPNNINIKDEASEIQKNE
jgi:hypothetical protein